MQICQSLGKDGEVFSSLVTLGNAIVRCAMNGPIMFFIVPETMILTAPFSRFAGGSGAHLMSSCERR